jgi:4-amino-4-deoxy-L-arabinose transferase-like glycosyltransferase
MGENAGRFAAVILVAIAARLAVMWPVRSLPIEDPDNYMPLARSLASGQGFALNGRLTAYRPPLYPILLAPAFWLIPTDPANWVRDLHVVLGAGTAAMVALAARRSGLSPARANLAALIVALDPVLVVQCRSVMTETLAGFLLALALAGVSSVSWMRSALVGGLALGLAALCRPSTLPAGVAIALLSATIAPGDWRRKFSRTFVLVGLIVLALWPWAVRNRSAVGEMIWTTTHGGYTLALANNAEYYDNVLDNPRGGVWTGSSQRAWQLRISKETSGMSEPEADRALRRDALAIAQARPRAFLRASLARLGRFWGLAPSASVYPTWLRILTAAWTLPLWVALLWGLSAPGAWIWPRVTAVAMVLALTAVHAVFWTDLRMRAPIVPAIALIAASAGIRGNKDADRHSR